MPDGCVILFARGGVDTLFVSAAILWDIGDALGTSATLETGRAVSGLIGVDTLTVGTFSAYLILF